MVNRGFLLQKWGYFMKVNGKNQPCPPGATVETLLQSLGHNPQRVAVEKNGSIIPRAGFASEALCDDDTLEIVQFVGGG